MARLPFTLLAALSMCAACGGAATSSPTPAGGTAALSAPGLAPASHVAYAALGASETFGIGANPVTNGYAYLVRDDLHAGGSTFADVGIPGVTLADGYQTELTNALSIRPTVCTVFFGVNDIRAGVSVSQFESDLRDLVATLRHAGAHVVIIGIPDLTNLPALRALRGVDLKAITTSWNAAMQRVSTATQSTFLGLDTFSAEITTHPEEVAADGLHPSNLGHARLAQIVYATLISKGYTTA